MLQAFCKVLWSGLHALTAHALPHPIHGNLDRQKPCLNCLSSPFSQPNEVVAFQEKWNQEGTGQSLSHTKNTKLSKSQSSSFHYQNYFLTAHYSLVKYMKLRNFGDNDLGLTHFPLLSNVILCNKTLLIQGVIFPQCTHL